MDAKTRVVSLLQKRKGDKRKLHLFKRLYFQHHHVSDEGPFKCYVTLFSWKFDPHPPPRNANNVEPYTFVTLFSGKLDTPPPHLHLHYVILEWPPTYVLTTDMLLGLLVLPNFHQFTQDQTKRQDNEGVRINWTCRLKVIKFLRKKSTNKTNGLERDDNRKPFYFGTFRYFHRSIVTSHTTPIQRRLI